MDATPKCAESGCDRDKSPKAGYGMCVLHYERRRRARTLGDLKPKNIRAKSALEKFLAYTEASKSCWWWTGPKNQHGYGLHVHDYVQTYAHRWAWQNFIGPIPDGMTIDHLCTNKVCVNPEHLEVVPIAVNSSRRHGNRVFCPRGHSMEDSYDRPDGDGRQCSTCISERSRKAWANRKMIACEFCGRVLSDMNMRAHQRKACKGVPSDK